MKQTLASKRPHYLAVNELRPAVHLAGYYHFKRDVRFQYRIPSHHLMLIESGRIEAQTEEGAFKATAGDLICFRPAEWNQYETHSPTSFYQVHAEFAGPPRHRLTPFFRDIGPLPACLSLGGYFADARNLFETICLEITHGGVVHQLRTVAALYELLAIAAGAIVPAEETVRRLNPWLRMQQRLDSTLNKELKTEELARQMSLSSEYFIRQFKHHFGISPKAYHTRARMQEAARALRGSDKSVKAVAFGLGFSDPKSFTRRFRHHLGVNPSDLRTSAPPDAAETPGAGNRIFPMNVHLLPPQVSSLCFDQYLPRKKRATPALDEQGTMADKVRHPEKYV